RAVESIGPVTKIVASIEARMTSSRLPGKVLMPAGGEPLLGILIRRLQAVPELSDVVVATTTNNTDDPVASLAEEYGASVFRGDENDVLGRVSGALTSVEANVAVEITGDCPLVDPALVSDCVTRFVSSNGKHRYVANTTGPRLGAPHGLDVQVFAADDLHAIASEVYSPEAREHVSTPFYDPANAARFNPLFVEHFPADLCRRVWISLDYKEDYDLIRAAYETLSMQTPLFGAKSLIDFCLKEQKMTQACLALRGWADGAQKAQA
ncbi:MAG: NTP transferase domain-containing protein, partial [Rhodospirillaceae bacterium]